MIYMDDGISVEFFTTPRIGDWFIANVFNYQVRVPDSEFYYGTDRYQSESLIVFPVGEELHPGFLLRLQ